MLQYVRIRLSVYTSHSFIVERRGNDFFGAFLFHKSVNSDIAVFTLEQPKIVSSSTRSKRHLFYKKDQMNYKFVKINYAFLYFYTFISQKKIINLFSIVIHDIIAMQIIITMPNTLIN